MSEHTPNGLDQLLPEVALCGDCFEITTLARLGRWRSAPYCSPHWLRLVGLAATDDVYLVAITALVMQRRELIRQSGRPVLPGDVRADLLDLEDFELPGMWERADLVGGSSDGC